MEPAAADRRRCPGSRSPSDRPRTPAPGKRSAKLLSQILAELGIHVDVAVGEAATKLDAAAKAPSMRQVIQRSLEPGAVLDYTGGSKRWPPGPGFGSAATPAPPRPAPSTRQRLC